MFIDFLTKVFEEDRESDAIIWRDQTFRYDWLLDRIAYWKERLDAEKITSGTVVAVEADFSPNAVALLLALTDHGCILVPLSNSVGSKRDEFMEIAQVEAIVALDLEDRVKITRSGDEPDHEILLDLKRQCVPGLILFSSGSTGKSKATVHNLAALLNKFTVRRFRRRAITFLLFDHIGGVNTILYQLSNGGCTVTVQDRSPDAVLRAIERYQVDLLPTSPTFLNLVLLSNAYQRHSLASLKVVTYGTEPMPESTLKHFHQLFPDIKLQQTYGLSEVGILRSKSRASDSLWVKIGGEGFETRVVADILHIKAETTMIGYLNAPSPFTDDGWFNTGDAVEVEGEYYRILGRASEIINVGGEKVYPAEVESAIQGFDNVAEVMAYGQPNPITGQIVCVKVNLLRKEQPKDFAKRLKRFCKNRLRRFQVPVKVEVVDEPLHGKRFKKLRG